VNKAYPDRIMIDKNRWPYVTPMQMMKWCLFSYNH